MGQFARREQGFGQTAGPVLHRLGQNMVQLMGDNARQGPSQHHLPARETVSRQGGRQKGPQPVAIHLDDGQGPAGFDVGDGQLIDRKPLRRGFAGLAKALEAKNHHAAGDPGWPAPADLNRKRIEDRAEPVGHAVQHQLARGVFELHRQGQREHGDRVDGLHLQHTDSRRPRSLSPLCAAVRKRSSLPQGRQQTPGLAQEVQARLTGGGLGVVEGFPTLGLEDAGLLDLAQRGAAFVEARQQD